MELQVSSVRQTGHSFFSSSLISGNNEPNSIISEASLLALQLAFQFLVYPDAFARFEIREFVERAVPCGLMALRPVWLLNPDVASRLLPVSSTPRALLLGGLWGWLPCGLVYSTLLWSAQPQ